MVSKTLSLSKNPMSPERRSSEAEPLDSSTFCKHWEHFLETPSSISCRPKSLGMHGRFLVQKILGNRERERERERGSEREGEREREAGVGFGVRG